MQPIDMISASMATPSVGAAISLEAVKKIPKYELHCHLGGAFPLEYLREIALPEDFVQLIHCLELISKGVDYHEGFKVFGLISKIVDTDKKVENGVVALCEQYAHDGAARVELRTGLKDLGTGIEGYLESVLRGIEKGEKSSGIKVDLLLSLRRDTAKDLCDKTAALAISHFGKGVCGMDLSGDSTMGKGDDALAAMKKAKEAGLKVSVHMGESPKETREQQLREIEMLAPDRVGHAVFLCEEAVQWIISREIPVEMCLTSSCKVGMTEKLSDHPAITWLKNGHPVAFCTDDPLVFGVSLTEECFQAASLLGWSESEFKMHQERMAGLFFHA